MRERPQEIRRRSAGACILSLLFFLFFVLFFFSFFFSACAAYAVVGLGPSTPAGEVIKQEISARDVTPSKICIFCFCNFRRATPISGNHGCPCTTTPNFLRFHGAGGTKTATKQHSATTRCWLCRYLKRNSSRLGMLFAAAVSRDRRTQCSYW